MYGDIVWPRRALIGPKRRCPARAGCCDETGCGAACSGDCVGCAVAEGCRDCYDGTYNTREVGGGFDDYNGVDEDQMVRAYY